MSGSISYVFESVRLLQSRDKVPDDGDIRHSLGVLSCSVVRA